MLRLFRELVESIRIAFAQIRANAMRSALTALGVIIGIVAVTLMGTAINGIDAGVDESFSGFGDDVLYVTKWPWGGVEDWWNIRNRPRIKIDYAAAVNEWIASQPDSPLKVAIPVAERRNPVFRGDIRVDSISTMGTSADYGRITKVDMAEGRLFSDFEALTGRNVIIIGYDVADALFPDESPIGKEVRIRGQRFTVVGVPTRQGSFLGMFSWDAMAAMPINTFKRFFGVRDNVQLRVQVDLTRMAEARDELRGLLRRVRQLKPEAADDFEINEQRIIRDQLDLIKRPIFIAGLVITGLALLVGAIGIMNITYVSVRERTREIGTRKALGARRRTILLQFLIEAVSICTVGGVIGLLVAGGLASLVAMVAPSFPLIYSFGLVFIGLVLSFFVGVTSGFAPAWQASKLDPVEALRYE